MNNLFIDLIDENIKCKNNIIDTLLLKNFGFIIKEDKLLKTKNSTTLFLKFNIEKFISSSKNIYFLNKAIKSNIKNMRNLNIVFSKRFNSISTFKNKVEEILNSINENCKYIKSSNNLKSNDKLYIERYIAQNNIDKAKFRILIVIDDIKDCDLNKIKEYIEEYKFLDILRMSNVSKSDYRRLREIVDNINNEYGSSIEIIQKRNIQNYDFYIIYSEGKKQYFNSHYVLNKKSYTLDVTDVDDDILSKEYRAYEKNKGYISTLFDRMNLNKDNFCKTDLGKLYN